jgi:hypothetical protein
MTGTKSVISERNAPKRCGIIRKDDYLKSLSNLTSEGGGDCHAARKALAARKDGYFDLTPEGKR